MGSYILKPKADQDLDEYADYLAEAWAATKKHRIPGDKTLSQPTLILLVRFRSPLSIEEVTQIAEERVPEFQALAGLQQKYYLRDAATGEYAGLYLWRSADDFSAYRDSELRASIAKAYQVESEPRIEVYQVMRTLREETA